MGYSLATETDGFSISLFLEAITSMRNTDIYESYDDFVCLCVLGILFIPSFVSSWFNHSR